MGQNVVATADEGPPDIQFSTEREGPNTLILTHGGGDAVRADTLTIYVGDTRTDWASNDETVAITEGDSTELSVRPGVDVKVLWDASDRAITEWVFETEV